MRLVVVAILLIGAACSPNVGNTDPDAWSIDTDSSPDAATLTSNGLVARYYLDEAASGGGTGSLVDSAASPLSLPITPVTTPSGSDPHYVEAASGRGLEWGTIENNGRACANVSGTKIFDAMHGATQGTIEAVIDFEGGSLNGSRILHIGNDNHWRFSLGYAPPDVLFYADDPLVNAGGKWSATVPADNRIVVTLVMDTSQAVAGNRIRLFQNGVARTLTDPSVLPTQGHVTDLSIANTFFCVGNREIGVRSPLGRIYYAALYEEPLTDAEVAANAGILLVNDDTPP